MSLIPFRKNFFSTLNENKYLYPFLLLACCIFYFVYTFKNYDLIPNDDYVYMNFGAYLSLPLTDNYAGFFYPLFFRLLFFLSGFKAILTDVYLAYYFISVGCFLCLYAYLKRLRISSSVSILTSVVFLFSDYQILIIPKISCFCLLLILFTVQFIQQKERFIRLFGITILCWVLSYTRPEFFISFLLAFLSLVIFFIHTQRYKDYSQVILLLLPAALLMFGIIFLGGQPITNRGLDAFKQHFIINYQNWFPNVVLDKKTGSEFLLFDKVFGKVKSTLDIFLVNPSFFLRHIFTNILTYFKLSFKLLYGIWFSPIQTVFGIYNKYVIIGSGLLMVFLTDFKATFSRIKSSFIYFGAKEGFTILLVLLPTFIAVILIYPREHYFLFHLIIYLPAIAIILENLIFRKIRLSIPLGLSFSMILLISVINKTKWMNYSTTKNLKMYEYMLQISREEHSSMMSNDLFTPLLFKENVEKYHYFNSQFPKNQLITNQKDVNNFLKVNSVNIIFLNLDAIDKTNQPLLEFIESRYLTYGFEKITDYQPLNCVIFRKKNPQ